MSETNTEPILIELEGGSFKSLDKPVKFGFFFRYGPSTTFDFSTDRNTMLDDMLLFQYAINNADRVIEDALEDIRTNKLSVIINGTTYDYADIERLVKLPEQDKIETGEEIDNN